VGPSGPFALDFGSVFQFAAPLGADLALLAELLPDIEPLILNHYRPEGGSEDGDA
jgi:hypothetical protein